jgi:hypothetical protein
MATSSGLITFSSAQSLPLGTGPDRWLRLTIDPPPPLEGITKAELAALLDNMVGITNHCTDQRAPGAWNPADGETLQARLASKLTGPNCQEAAAGFGVGSRCRPERRAGLPIQKNVYVHWSDEQLAEQYTLQPLGSAIVMSGPSRGRKMLEIVVDVTDSTSAPVRYYADPDRLADVWRDTPPRWIGNVLRDRRIVPGPSVRWAGGKVIFGGQVSGRLWLRLPIIYDAWSISIPGTWLGSGKRSYRAKVLALSPLLEAAAEIVIEDETEGDPDAQDCSACGGDAEAVDDDDSGGGGTGTGAGRDIYCYVRIDWILYKSCTGESVDTGTRYVQVTCPEGNLTARFNRGFNPIPDLPDYIYEVARYEEERYTGETESLITPAEYKDTCCYDAVKVPDCIPQCERVMSTWQGTTWPRLEEELRRGYAGQTSFVYVGPGGGLLPCGTRTDVFVPPRRPCAKGVCKITIRYSMLCAWEIGTDAVAWESAGQKLSGESFVSRSVDLPYVGNCQFQGTYISDYYNAAGQYTGSTSGTATVHFDRKKNKFLPIFNFWKTDPTFATNDQGVVLTNNPVDTDNYIFSALEAVAARPHPYKANEIDRDIQIVEEVGEDEGWHYSLDCEIATYIGYVESNSAGDCPYSTFLSPIAPSCD